MVSRSIEGRNAFYDSIKEAKAKGEGPVGIARDFAIKQWPAVDRPPSDQPKQSELIEALQNWAVELEEALPRVVESTLPRLAWQVMPQGTSSKVAQGDPKAIVYANRDRILDAMVCEVVQDAKSVRMLNQASKRKLVDMLLQNRGTAAPPYVQVAELFVMPTAAERRRLKAAAKRSLLAALPEPADDGLAATLVDRFIAFATSLIWKEVAALKATERPEAKAVFLSIQDELLDGLKKAELEDVCLYRPALEPKHEDKRPIAYEQDLDYLRSKFNGGPRDGSFEFFPTESKESKGPQIHGVMKRKQEVSCWAGHFVAFSVRTAEQLTLGKEGEIPTDMSGIRCGYAPRPFSPTEGFWFGIDDGVAVIHKALKSALKDREVGLIAICGETSAAKSQHTLGLIYERLRDKNATFRIATDAIANGGTVSPGPYEYTHLLTLEEPIEDYLFYKKKGERKFPLHPSETASLGVHYTPRDLLFDCGKDDRDVLYREGTLTPLARALQLDALRQKPTVVLVGESRNDPDLKEVVRFAATGHQIYTTFHAGSLQEGLGKILKAWDAKASSDRGEIATRIHAVIHLRAHSIRGQKFCLPSVWVGTERALDGLVKDGLRSVIPQRAPASEESAVLGRLYFAQRLREHRQSRFVVEILNADAKRKRDLNTQRDAFEPVATAIEHLAVGWDLDER